MCTTMKRKLFIRAASVGLLGCWLSTKDKVFSQRLLSDPYPSEAIQEFVAAGHNDLHRVKKLLSRYPNIVNATWDWGGGDFETAIEGAGHMGNKQMADYLIAAGARSNLFTATMMGDEALVKAWLELYPDALHAPGPHGFTLLHHAKVGGNKELASYLQIQGLVEEKIILEDR